MDDYVLTLAERIASRTALAGLTPDQAKLYSQATLTSLKQPALRTWSTNDARQRFSEAIRLVEVAFTLKDAGHEKWRAPLRRSGEILEWLASAEYSEVSVDLRLLSAALYQLAGLPAMAACLLSKSETTGEHDHKIVLRSFLRADFPGAMEGCRRLWPAIDRSNQNREIKLDWGDTNQVGDNLAVLVAAEVAKAISVVCAYQRWGEQQRLNAAISKLDRTARVYQNARDSTEWVLARLVAETAKIYAAGSLRNHLSSLYDSVNSEGQEALDRYARQAYQHERALAWPSQIQGISRLRDLRSFALCTPTGSGKTAVAEIALIQSLFARRDIDSWVLGPMALYLVPSRALAGQVERRLTNVLAQLGQSHVRVTGLYGGADWSPGDAWIISEEKTILICTFEKAEALIRFLGPLFVQRLSVIVVDEAHKVELDPRAEGLPDADNRSLRMESLFARMTAAGDCRAIGLSAVTSAAPSALESWISATQVKPEPPVAYRSTRQLFGALLCGGSEFRAEYHVLDGSSLEFTDDRPGLRPFIPNLFPSPRVPDNWGTGPEVRLRPYLLWAALGFAAGDPSGRRSAVLISVPQQIDGYARDFCKLLDYWSDETPKHFEVPQSQDLRDLYQDCIECCRDYYGDRSIEARLLEKGVVIHRASLPGPLGRLLVRAIELRVFNVVLATSTLTEGLNLPFEVVLIPSLFRANEMLSISEVRNLMGRAGRPGAATEGRTFVMLYRRRDAGSRRALRAYIEVVRALTFAIPQQSILPKSSLAELILGIEKAWKNVFPEAGPGQFEEWLESTIPSQDATGEVAIEERGLDVLDGVLLPAVVEQETFANVSARPAMEEKLAEIWRRTYAFVVSSDQERIGRFFVQRGGAILAKVYPDTAHRRVVYATGLSPLVASSVLAVADQLRQLLVTGSEYIRWSFDDRLKFISKCIEVVGQVDLFKPKLKIKLSKVDWRKVLSWWMLPGTDTEKPKRPEDASTWIEYVAANFVYRFSWGLGSVLSKILSVDDLSTPAELRIQSWPETGLPWIALWLRDLLAYGTVNPAEAFLLSRGFATDRAKARLIGSMYEANIPVAEYDDAFNPRRIQQWALATREAPQHRQVPETMNVRTTERYDRGLADSEPWRVIPREDGEKVHWFDAAGTKMAESMVPDWWQSRLWRTHDFWLAGDQILSSKYLPDAF